MLLGSTTTKAALRPLADGRHRARVERIVARFAAAFPEIGYDIYWESRTLNAQAYLWKGERRVRLYGGLARHRRLSIAGIAWVLAHETGHHLGGPPYHPLQPALSSEEQAEKWATVGVRRVFPRNLAMRYADVGARELARLLD